MNPTLGRVVIGKEKPKIVEGPQNQKRSRPTELVDSAFSALSKRAKKKVVLQVNVKKAKKYATHPEFVGQSLEEKNGSLFCIACNKFVSFKKKMDVVQHCFGVRGKGGKLKDLKHFNNLQLLLARAEDKNALTNAIKVERKLIDTEEQTY
jgi:hypothetical protein